MAASVRVAAKAPGETTAIDTRRLQQDGERTTREPRRIEGGVARVPERAGLGLVLAEERLEAAHAFSREDGHGTRDDAAAMQRPPAGAPTPSTLPRAIRRDDASRPFARGPGPERGAGSRHPRRST